jgi:uncharacterized protein with HEPN domain
MRLDDETRLHHMLDAARRASAFIAGRSREDLDEEDLQTQGLVRMLEIIGEAASQVSSEGRAKWGGINWRPIIGMRNRLIHAYFDVDLDVVWLTAVDDLPPLIAELERILASLGDPSAPEGEPR